MSSRQDNISSVSLSREENTNVALSNAKKNESKLRVTPNLMTLPNSKNIERYNTMQKDNRFKNQHGNTGEKGAGNLGTSHLSALKQVEQHSQAAVSHDPNQNQQKEEIDEDFDPEKAAFLKQRLLAMRKRAKASFSMSSQRVSDALAKSLNTRREEKLQAILADTNESKENKLQRLSTMGLSQHQFQLKTKSKSSNKVPSFSRNNLSNETPPFANGVHQTVKSPANQEKFTKHKTFVYNFDKKKNKANYNNQGDLPACDHSSISGSYQSGENTPFEHTPNPEANPELDDKQRDNLAEKAVAQFAMVSMMNKQERRFNVLIGQDAGWEDPTPDLVEGIFEVDTRSLKNILLGSPKVPKTVIYDQKSLNLLHFQNLLRIWIVKIVSNTIFDSLVLLAILLNSLKLAFYDYGDPEDKSDLNKNFILLGNLFSIFFTIECALKILAMGLFTHQNAYLRDSWNWIDFLVVVSGLLEMSLGEGSGFKALRIFRVLRPLKSINQFPAMRRLISSLLASLSNLANTVLFMVFIFVLFGILGVQLFSGTFYRRCRYSEMPPSQLSWPFDEDFGLCSPNGEGLQSCPPDMFCREPWDAKLPLEIDQVDQQELINFGLTTFDNLGAGMVTIFQIITLEGWSKILYLVMDSNITLMAVFYFVSVIVVGSFFLLNVILAVLSEALYNVEEYQQRQDEKKREALFQSLERAKKQDDQEQIRKKQAELEIDYADILGQSSRHQSSDSQQKSVDESSQEGNKQMQQSSQQVMEKVEDETPKNGEPNRNFEAAVNRNQRSVQQDKIEEEQESANQRRNQVSNSVSVDENEEELFLETSPDRQQKENRVVEKEPNNSLSESFVSEKIGSSSNASLENSPSRGKNQQKNQFSQQDKQNLAGVSQKFNHDLEEEEDAEFFYSENFANGQYSGIPERAAKNRIYRFFYLTVTNILFTVFITLLIILNTVILSLDKYPSDPKLEQLSATFNEIFTWCFTIEMIMKLIGLGPRDYLRDKLNIFDAAIVILSLVDIALTALNVDSGGDFTAGRLIRLFRIFKLARSWTSFRQILTKIIITMRDISTFSVLLVIFAFIFTLLGMELFSHKLTLDEQGMPPRANFDTINFGVTTIFIVFIGEDWQTVLFDFREMGWIATTFFIVLFISLNLVLLNLFLAILLENFQIENKEMQLDDDEKTESQFRKVSKKVSQCFKEVCKRRILPLSSSKEQQSLSDDISCSDSDEYPSEQNLNNSPAVSGSKEKRIKFAQNSNSSFSSVKFGQNCQDSPSSKKGKSLNQSSSFLRSIRQNQQNNQSLILSKEEAKNITEKSEEEISSSAYDSKDANIDNKSAEKLELSRFEQKKSETRRGTLILKPEEFSLKFANNELEELERTESKNLQMYRKAKTLDDSKNPPNVIKRSQEAKKLRLMIQSSDKKQSLSKVKQQTILQDSTNTVKIIKLRGKSLGIFSKQNKFRKFCKRVVAHKYYTWVVFLLIGISSLFLTQDNPLYNPKGSLTVFLEYSDIVLTLLFTIECLLNIIVFGFVNNGVQSYMKDPWNVMDFFIVVTSIISITFSQIDFGIFKIFRMLRILRPLRLLKRNLGLKLQVMSLLNSIPDIGNLMLISCLLLLLFGIKGGDFFRGKFYYCNLEMIEQAQENLPISLTFQPIKDRVLTEWDCMDYGGEWINYSLNFDNALNSMLTMFSVMTTEGWIDIMWRAVDTTNVHQVPRRDENLSYIAFFMLFLIICGLFIVNLFVGVVINTFNSEKDKLSHNNLLTDLQTEYANVMIKVYQSKPRMLYVSAGNKVQDWCYQIASSKYFETFILVIIVLNTIVLGLVWYAQSQWWLNVTEKLNYVFTGIYTLEMVIKLVALRKNYFQDNWNNFDFFIVIAAYVGFFLKYVLGISLGTASTIVRSFRISRIVKLIRKAKNLQKIIQTFVLAIPELGNVGALLFLFLFLFSILGTYLFAEIKLNQELNEHANFQSFPNSLLTLFRITTGEGWQELMNECSQGPSILYQCQQEFTYEDIKEQGPVGCGGYSSVVYFVSFTVIVSLIFLNLFIAIILEGFAKSSQQSDIRIDEQTIEKFQEVWQRYDSKATGMIPVRSLEKVVCDLVDFENNIIEESAMRSEADVLFNLHKIKIVNLYTLFKRKRTKEFQEANFEQDWFLKKLLEKHFMEFLSDMEIPSYDELLYFNYYDVLNAIALSFFKEQHRIDFQQRQDRIETAKANGDELVNFDALSKDCPEFYQLRLIDQERVLELEEPEFQKVVNRLEYKGLDQDEQILKLKDLRKLRSEQAKKVQSRIDYIDAGAAECDSRHVLAALSIVNQIEEIFMDKRKRKAEVAEREARWAAERLEQEQKQNSLKESQQDIVLPVPLSCRNQTERISLDIQNKQQTIDPQEYGRGSQERQNVGERNHRENSLLGGDTERPLSNGIDFVGRSIQSSVFDIRESKMGSDGDKQFIAGLSLTSPCGAVKDIKENLIKVQDNVRRNPLDEISETGKDNFNNCQNVQNSAEGNVENQVQVSEHREFLVTDSYRVDTMQSLPEVLKSTSQVSEGAEIRLPTDEKKPIDKLHISKIQEVSKSVIHKNSFISLGESDISEFSSELEMTIIQSQRVKNLHPLKLNEPSKQLMSREGLVTASRNNTRYLKTEGASKNKNIVQPVVIQGNLGTKQESNDMYKYVLKNKSSQKSEECSLSPLRTQLKLKPQKISAQNKDRHLLQPQNNPANLFLRKKTEISVKDEMPSVFTSSANGGIPAISGSSNQNGSYPRHDNNLAQMKFKKSNTLNLKRQGDITVLKVPDTDCMDAKSNEEISPKINQFHANTLNPWNDSSQSQKNSFSVNSKILDQRFGQPAVQEVSSENDGDSDNLDLKASHSPTVLQFYRKQEIQGAQFKILTENPQKQSFKNMMEKLSHRRQAKSP